MRRPSGTMAIPRPSRRWAGTPSSGRPSKATVPVLCCWRPATVRSRVDLPAPLAPITATVSPSATRTDTSNRAWKSP